MKTKYILLVLVVLTTLFALIGAEKMPSQVEIENFEVVNIVGLDKTSDGVEVTVLRDNISSSAEGNEKEKSKPFSIKASSYVEAVQKLKTDTDKYITITHADYFLVGDKAAKEDIHDIVDFLSRIYKVSFSSQIIIVDKISSKEFLEDISHEEYNLQDNFEEVFANLLSKNYTTDTKLVDMLESFLRVNDVIAVPLVNNNSEEVDNDDDKLIINCQEVVFINDHFEMCLKLTKEQTLEYNLVLGNVEYFQMDLENIHFGLIDKKSEISFGIKDNNINSLNIDVLFDAKIEEDDTNGKIFNQEKINIYEEKLSEELKRLILEIINKSIETNIDFLKLENKFQLKHPYVYRKISASCWEQIKSSNIHINAKCNIVNTYDIQESSFYQKEEK